MRLAARTRQIAGKTSNAWDTHYIAADMIARGEDVILLTVGDTDFASPPEAVAAVHAALAAGRTSYGGSAGSMALRGAIARRHSANSGQTVEADQVIVTIGAQNGLSMAALCLLNEGDEVIVPEPMYVTYPGSIAVAGATTVSVPSPADNGFHPLVEAMEAAVTRRTKAIFLATPNNPTGAVYTREELVRIGEICRRHDLWLVSDEVYGDIVHCGEHVSPAALPGMAERTVTLGSLSKSHAMAGWRLGWMIGPKDFAAAAAQLVTCATYGVPTFLQDAAIAALEAHPQGLAGLQAAYARRRDRFCAQLDAIPGLSCRKPDGGMFVMLDVRSSGVSARDFAMGLVREEGVAVLPADDFGPSAVGYLRINLGARDELIEEAAIRIARYAAKLAERRAPATA